MSSSSPESEDEYSDDDDMSWKVRRAAAKCMAALISSRPDLLPDFHCTLAPALIRRFKEREENVKADIFGAYIMLLRHTRPPKGWLEAVEEPTQTGRNLNMLRAQVDCVLTHSLLPFFLSVPISSLAEGCGVSTSLCPAWVFRWSPASPWSAWCKFGHGQQQHGLAGVRRPCLLSLNHFWLVGGEWIVTGQESWLGTNRRTLHLCQVTRDGTFDSEKAEGLKGIVVEKWAGLNCGILLVIGCLCLGEAGIS
jgi:hypothetical protein